MPVLVDFWAEWCGPCKMTAPEYAKAAQALAGRAVLLKVNTEAQQGLAAEYGIRSIPTFMLFLQGRRVANQAGAVSALQIQALVDEHTG